MWMRLGLVLAVALATVCSGLSFAVQGSGVSQDVNGNWLKDGKPVESQKIDRNFVPFLKKRTLDGLNKALQPFFLRELAKKRSYDASKKSLARKPSPAANGGLMDHKNYAANQLRQMISAVQSAISQDSSIKTESYSLQFKALEGFLSHDKIQEAFKLFEETLRFLRVSSNQESVGGIQLSQIRSAVRDWVKFLEGGYNGGVIPREGFENVLANVVDKLKTYISQEKLANIRAQISKNEQPSMFAAAVEIYKIAKNESNNGVKVLGSINNDAVISAIKDWLVAFLGVDEVSDLIDKMKSNMKAGGFKSGDGTNIIETFDKIQQLEQEGNFEDAAKLFLKMATDNTAELFTEKEKKKIEETLNKFLKKIESTAGLDSFLKGTNNNNNPQ